MPELPEVETIRNSLEQAILHKTIKSVVLKRDGLRDKFPHNMKQLLCGETITSVDRRGKYLIISGKNCYFLVHFGMSGYFSLQKKAVFNTHAHVRIKFNDGQYLVYTDPRRFGRMTTTVLPWQDHPWLSSIGAEPLGDDFSAVYLQKVLKSKSMPIKSALMDARVVAGVGNIYAAEALFSAGLLPSHAANSLCLPSLRKIVTAVRTILQQAILAGGSTIRDFVNTEGHEGHFQMQWKVYGRAGLPCRKCGTAIIKTTQSGRSTFYCRRCQR